MPAGAATAQRGGSTLAAIQSRGLPLLDDLGSGTLVDLAACQMTRYPPGLLGALEHIDSIGSPTRAATPATSHLWLAPVAFTNDVADGRHSGHAVMNERMALLREL